MSNNGGNKMSWKEQFDEKFGYLMYSFDVDDIKQFIEEEIKRAEQEAVEEYRMWLRNKF